MEIIRGKYYLLLTVALCLIPASKAYATVTNEDFIGTWDGSISTNHSLCVDPNENGTVTGNWTVTSFNLSGNSYEFRGTTNATLDGSTIEFEGTATIAGDTFTSMGDLLLGDGTVIGSFNSNGTLFDTGQLQTMVSGVVATPGGGCSFNSSVDAQRVDGGIVVNPAVTPSSTLTSPLLLNTQIKNVSTNIGSRIGDVLRGTSTGLQRTGSGFLFDATSGLNAGDSLPVIQGLWGSYSYADYDNDLSSTAFDGHTHSVMTGMDFTPWENSVLGVAISYENSDVDTTFNRGNQETDGFTVIPYFGYLLTDTLGIDFSFGYSWLSSDQFRIAPGTTTRITSSPDGHRWFGMFNLNGVTVVDNWIFGGRTGFLLAKQTTDNFIESNGTAVAEVDSKLGQWSISGDVAYSYGEWEPFARLTYEYDYSLTEITVIGGGPQPSNDPDGFLIGTGIRYFNNNGWSGNLEWSHRLGRENLDEDTFILTIRGEF